LKKITFSKVFVLSFIALIFSACLIPSFQYFINLIYDLNFIMSFLFFYQLQINLHIYLFEQLLLPLLICWIIFDFIINPSLFLMGVPKAIKRFILTRVLKKKLDIKEFNLLDYDKTISDRNDKKNSDQTKFSHLLLNKAEKYLSYHQRYSNTSNNGLNFKFYKDKSISLTNCRLNFLINFIPVIFTIFISKKLNLIKNHCFYFFVIHQNRLKNEFFLFNSNTFFDFINFLKLVLILGIYKFCDNNMSYLILESGLKAFLIRKNFEFNSQSMNLLKNEVRI